MKKILYFALGLLICTQSFSQEKDLIKELELKILNGQNDSAIRIANEILNIDSLNWLVSFYKGKALYSKYKYFEALHQFKKANSLDTANYIIENALAETYDAIGNDEAAIQLYYDQYVRDTNKIEPIVKLANSFRKSREYGSAIYYYQKATALDLENFYYYKQQGYCLNKIELPQPAIYAYQSALMFNPQDLSVYQQLSNIYNSERMFDDAIISSDKGLSYYPGDKQLLKIKAYSFYLKRDFDSSITVFNRLFEMGDSSFFNLKYQGLAFFENKQFVNAIKNLKLAHEFDEKDAEVSFFLGSGLGRSNEGEEGLYYLNKTIRTLSPSAVEMCNIHSEMAHIFLNQKDYKKSLEHLKIAYKFESKPILSFKMAQLYDYYLDNKKLAIDYYNGYLTMTVPTEGDSINASVVNSYLADQRVIENAEQRIRILKEELFFESGNKK